MVGDHLVVVGGDGIVSALDSASGAVAWQVSVGLGSTRSDHLVCDGDRGYFHACRYDYDGDVVGDSFLFALDAATGREHWRVATGQEMFGEVAVADGVVVVLYLYSGLLAAFDAATGEALWNREPIVDFSILDDAVISLGTSVAAVDLRSGEERWKYDTRGLATDHCIGAGRVFIAAAAENRLALIDGKENPSTTRSRLLALDADSGRELWPGNHQQQANLVADRLVYGGDWSEVEERLAAAGDVAGVVQCPFALDHIVYAGGQVYAGSSVGGDGPRLLQAFDGDTGREIWRLPIDADPVRLAVVDNLIIATGYGGSTCVFEDGPSDPIQTLKEIGAPDPKPGDDRPQWLGAAPEPGTAMFRGNPARTGVLPGPGPKGQPRELWRFDTGEHVMSSPAIVDGVVYVGSLDNHIYAVDAVTGAEIDRFPTGFRVWSSPAIVSGVLYVGSNDKHLYAIDIERRTGWRRDIGHAVVSSPVVVDDVVYVGSYDNAVYALDADNLLRVWRFETGAGVRSTPAVADGAVFIGSNDKHIYALDAKSGSERWRFATGGEVRSSPAVADGVVYAGSTDGNLYALDAETGVERWRFHLGGSGTQPSVADGVVYVLCNHLHAIDAINGEELWRYPISGRSTPVVVDGFVYAIADDGILYALCDEAIASEARRAIPVDQGTDDAGLDDFFATLYHKIGYDGLTGATLRVGSPAGVTPGEVCPLGATAARRWAMTRGPERAEVGEIAALVFADAEAAAGQAREVIDRRFRDGHSETALADGDVCLGAVCYAVRDRVVIVARADEHGDAVDLLRLGVAATGEGIRPPAAGA